MHGPDTGNGDKAAVIQPSEAYGRMGTHEPKKDYDSTPRDVLPEMQAGDAGEGTICWPGRSGRPT